MSPLRHEANSMTKGVLPLPLKAAVLVYAIFILTLTKPLVS
jgi:hypothetical protein